jgi:uncharacterized membrane protein YheB (UPF0754 family)
MNCAFSSEDISISPTLFTTQSFHVKLLEWINDKMVKRVKMENFKKREKIQSHFWNEVGAIEHISLPRLEDSVRKEFKFEDDRLVQRQIDFMLSEKRISIESRVKVWIKQPKSN